MQFITAVARNGGFVAIKVTAPFVSAVVEKHQF